jgi:tetratricopeptide (TPR) repeat protein/CHAT domain-containing protein
MRRVIANGVPLALVLTASVYWTTIVGAKSAGPEALLSLAIELLQAGKYTEAAPLVERYSEAMKIRRRADTPQYAAALIELGSMYQKEHHYSEAEPLYQRALAIDEKAFGSDHEIVGTALKNLANLFDAQGRYAEAESLYERALAIDEKTLDPNLSISIATDLNKLANLHRAQGHYSEAEPIYRRALAITEKTLGPDHLNVARALNDIAELYVAQGRYAEAEPLMQRALAIAEKTLGPDHPDVATRYNNLAALYTFQGRYGDATILVKRALAITEKALGPEHPDVGTEINNIATLDITQGRYAEAEPLMRRALAIHEKALGPDNPTVGHDLNLLAELYRRQARYAEAEPLLKRALTIAERTLGPDHPDVAIRLYYLAGVYQYQARYAEAEPLYKRSLAITEKALGSYHPDVALRLVALGSLYSAQGRYSDAEPLYERAVAIQEKALGPEHPIVGLGLNQLASVYERLGRYVEAEALYKRALAIQEKTLGPNHPDVGTDLNNIARLDVAQGRYAEAEPLYERALAIAENALGPTHPDVGTDLNKIARLDVAQGRYADAEPLYKRALAIAEKTLGPDHPDIGASLDSLASLHQQQGRYSDAELDFKRALAIWEKALGPDHPSVGTDLNNLAGLYREQGRYAEAEPLIKRALAIQEKALGPEHTYIGSDLNSLASVYIAQRRYAEAEPIVKRALAIQEKALGPEHPDVGTDLYNLASLYIAQRRYTEAEPFLKRALAIQEKALGPEHPNVSTDLSALAEVYLFLHRYAEAEPLMQRALAIQEKARGPEHPYVGGDLNDLAVLYDDQGRYAEAEPLYKRALAIDEKALGPNHPNVARDLNNIAMLYLERGDWRHSVEFWRRSTAVTTWLTQRGTMDVGQALTGKRKTEAQQSNWQFWDLIKAAYRLASSQSGADARIQQEMFEAAQWAQSSEAAHSLAQMAARGAKGDPNLADLIRERQDLVSEWQTRDANRSTAVALSPDARKRQSDAETQNVARLTEIDKKISSIDAELVAKFPDYAALASPAPLSVEDVQALLSADEALVLFLDTPKMDPMPEETIAWVVTKADTKWVRSELGTRSLTRHVGALRCGLDYQGTWFDDKGEWNGSRCEELLETIYTRADHDVLGKPAPFDVARAHALYKALFGQIEDLIKDKRLLIVPSGPLTQLPFQVLVTGFSNDVPSGERVREIAKLGAEFVNLSEEERKHLQLTGNSGVRIFKVIPDTAAEAAGLRPDDIVLSFDGVEYATSQTLVAGIQVHPPGARVQIQILRNAADLTVTATLGATTIREWIPRFLANGEGKKVDWLARKHAITVLPAVSSLKALRALAKESHASEAFIGFGDPLLDGEPTKFSNDAIAAKLAREARCPPGATLQLAASADRGATRAAVRSSGGLADVADLRSWAPLPETADELCDVAQNLGVDPTTHLYLGAKATETEIKRLSAEGALAKYKIIHLATHGAIAGELSGTSEPGLILTPPDEASEADDGYLSASEIAALKLDADWVILSACNTAAGDAKGAEALSGLARAFFYAGARSLLVSHWEVSSDSTVKLITKAIAELKTDPTIGRAEALRRSMLSMIDTGKAYEAHPAFWAPFVLVGEEHATVSGN